MVEEIKVYENGSGHFRFAYGVEANAYPQFEEVMPEEYRLENLFSNLLQDESVTDFTQEQYEADGRIWDSIELEISDIEALFVDEKRIGPILVSIDEEDGQFRFEQTIDLNISNVTIPSLNLLDLSGAGFTLKLITPQIVDSNGVHSGAGVSQWKVSMDDFVSDGESVYVQAEYRLEPYEGVFIPWDVIFPYIVFGFLSLGLLTVFLVIYFNTRVKKKDDQRLKIDL
jgi:hypothetical protein